MTAIMMIVRGDDRPNRRDGRGIEATEVVTLGTTIVTIGDDADIGTRTVAAAATMIAAAAAAATILPMKSGIERKDEKNPLRQKRKN